MANTIRIKRSTGSSNPTSLENAEVAFREGDEVLVYGTGTGGSGGSATSIIAIGGKGAFFDKATVRAANLVLSGPTTGSDAAPTFRSLVVADIPTLTASKVSDFDTQVRTNRLDQLASATNTVSGVTPSNESPLLRAVAIVIFAVVAATQLPLTSNPSETESTYPFVAK